MENYDPYNPNDLDEILKEMNENRKMNNKTIDNEKEIKGEQIGWNILRKMGWQGKGIHI